jgi:hypothetical protein
MLSKYAQYGVIAYKNHMIDTKSWEPGDFCFYVCLYPTIPDKLIASK